MKKKLMDMRVIAIVLALAVAAMTWGGSVTGCGGSSEDEIIPNLNIVPNPPVALSATAGNGQVTLTWTAAEGAMYYNVYYGVSGSGELIQNNISETSYIHVGLTNGTEYFYQVTAVNEAGESSKSAEVSAIPVAPVPIIPDVDVVLPSVPANLIATAGDGQVTLTWDASEGASYYNVYYGVSGSGELIEANVSGTSYVDDGLTNGTEYFYQITAVNDSGESEKSIEVPATPAAAAIPDEVGPQIESVTPADGTVNVSVETHEIIITFNEDMNVVVPAGAVTIIYGDSVAVSGSVSFTDSRTLVFSTEDSFRFEPLTVYTVMVSAALTDVAGNVLALTPEEAGGFTFTTGSGWGGAVVLDSRDTRASSHRVAIDMDGDAVVVWLQLRGRNIDLWSNEFVLIRGDFSWSGAQVVDSLDSHVSSPWLSMNGGGDAVAVWVQGGDIYSSIKTDRLGAPVGLDTGANPASEPQVAIANHGGLIAVWTQNFDAAVGNDIVGTIGIRGAWLPIRGVIENLAGACSSPVLSVNNSVAEGAVMAAWFCMDGAESSKNIYAVDLPAGPAEYLLVRDTEPANEPSGLSIVNNSNGLPTAATVAWAENKNTWLDRFDGTNWLAADVQISSAGAGDASAPQVTMDSGGTNSSVIWQQSADIFSRVYNSLGLLSDIFEEDTGTVYVSSPQIGVDSMDNRFYVWERDGNIVAEINDMESGESVTTTLDASGLASNPQLAVSRDGKAIAVWVNEGDIVASTYR